MISFTIPIKPLSQNAVYKRAYHGRLFMTPEGHVYKEAIAWAAREAMKGRKLFEGYVKVELIVYMANALADPANTEKLIFDALEGVVYKNDRQLRSHTCTGFIDKLNPRIELTIQSFDPASQKR